MKNARLLMPACLVGIFVGCGQKGPLVQPDVPKHKKVPASPRVPVASAPTSGPTEAPPKP